MALYGHDPLDGGRPRFQRRWQVWQTDTATTTGGVKGIAVSVTYREPSLPGLREVVLLTQVSNRALLRLRGRLPVTRHALHRVGLRW